MSSRLKEIFQDKDRRRGVIGTTIVHLLLIVALLFLALRTPLPLPGEEGVEVNLGYDDTGFGDIQTDSPPQQMETPPPMPQQEISVPEPVVEEEEIITQDTEETPFIEEEITEEIKEEPEPEPEEIIEELPEPQEEIIEEIVEKTVDSALLYSENITEEIVTEPENVVIQEALFQGSSQNTSGTNQGIEGGTGDQGKPHGYEDSNKYDGKGGSGNGISFSLGGRGSKFLDKPSNTFREAGDVVIRIEVDQNGDVVSASFLQKGSTVGISDEKVKLALDAAKNSAFTADKTAPDKQRGTITYKFVK